MRQRLCVLLYEGACYIPLMLGSLRPSVMSNKFIVRNVWITVRNIYWNVHLKSDPRIPGHKPWFSSFRSELNPCPLPAHTNTLPHGALTRHKPHHHPSVAPDLPGHKILPLLFSMALFTSFPFCLPSQPVPVTSEPLWMVAGGVGPA